MNEIMEKVLGFLAPYQDKVLHYYDLAIQQFYAALSGIGLSREDFLTGLLLFVTEVSVVLLLIIGIMYLAGNRKRNKDVLLAKQLKEKIKEYLPAREEKLKAIIADMVPQDESWAAKSAEEAAGYEKHLYSKILKIILRKDMENAMGIHNDVERLGDSYQRIVAHLGEAAITVSDAGGGSSGDTEAEKISELKSIVAKLRKEKQALQDELEASIKSVDNIVKEYSRIYSDAPNKEGSEVLEKEIAMLREKMGVHIGDEDGLSGSSDDPEPDPPPSDTPETTMVIPDVDIDKNEELKQLREETGLDKEA